jgi:hypothetical protein
MKQKKQLPKFLVKAPVKKMCAMSEDANFGPIAGG